MPLYHRCLLVSYLFLAMLVGAGCPSPPAGAPEISADSADNDHRGLDRLKEYAGPVVRYRDIFAVVVGIDDYDREEDLGRLQFATNDARAIADVLCEEFGYQRQNVLCLFDQDATLGALRSAFDSWLPSRAVSENDSVMFFFAGHGLIEQPTREGYLALVDSNTRDISTSGVSVSWIRNQLQRLPCRHKAMILDSCYSGSLFMVEAAASRGHADSPARANARSADFPPNESKPASHNDNLMYYLSHPAFLGMSAGRLTPVADGLGKNKHSVFTTAVLETLRRRADSPREDNCFTFRQLASQVEARVASAEGSHQIPNWGLLEPGDGDFVFFPRLRRIAQIAFDGLDGAQLHWTLEGGGYAPSALILPVRHDFEQGWDYRLKLTNIPAIPGITLYPRLTIALPHTHAAALVNTTVPVRIAKRAIESAGRGKSVTLAVYRLDENRGMPPLGLPRNWPPVDDESPPATPLAPRPGSPPAVLKEDVTDPFGPVDPQPRSEVDPFAPAVPSTGAAAPPRGSLLDEVLAERPAATPPISSEAQQNGGTSATPFLDQVFGRSGFLATVDSERLVLEGKTKAEVMVAIESANNLARNDPQQAIADLTLLLETIQRSPELSTENAANLRQQLLTAITDIQLRGGQLSEMLERVAELLPHSPDDARYLLSLFLDRVSDIDPPYDVLRALSARASPLVAKVNDALDPAILQALDSSQLPPGIDVLVEAEARGTLVAVLRLGNLEEAASRPPGPTTDPSGVASPQAAPARFISPGLTSSQRQEVQRLEFEFSVTDQIARALDMLRGRRERDAVALLQDELKLIDDAVTISPSIRNQLKRRIVQVLGLALEPLGDANYRALAKFRRKLEEMSILEFVETPLQDVIHYVESAYSLPITIDERRLEEAAVSLETPVTATERLPLGTALNEILSDLDLAAVLTNKGLRITSDFDPEPDLAVVMYPVLDLLEGPDKLEIDELLGLVGRFVAPESWTDGANVEFIPSRKLLVVKQSWIVHQQLFEFLNTLRGATDE